MKIRHLISVIAAVGLAGCATQTTNPVTDSAVADTTTDTGADDTAAPPDAAGDTTVAPEDTQTVDDTGSADTASPTDTGTAVDATPDTTTPDDTQTTDATPIDATEKCPGEPLCNALAPDCEAPLIPVVKNDCWGCGYPESCSCSDGGPDLCDMIPPDCPAGQELATQNGCFECVDPMTCKPVPPPPNDTCAADGECVATEYEILVTDVADCFCPMCPSWPATQAQHQARKEAWEKVCGAWAKDKPCPMPKCANPGTPFCSEESVCQLKPEGCDGELLCDGLPIPCEAPFVSIVKDDCWACGYAETCSCSIADTPTCKSPVPNCPKDTIVAIQPVEDDPNYTCYRCVNPETCLEVKEPEKECVEKGDCTLTNKDPAITVNSEADCYCPMCANWAVPLEKSKELNGAWNKHCKAWADKQPCLPPPCPPPPGPAQCLDGQCAMPDFDAPPGG